MKTKKAKAHLDLTWRMMQWYDIYLNCNKAQLTAHCDTPSWPRLGVRRTWSYDEYVTDEQIADAVASITEYIGRFIVGDGFEVDMVPPPEWIEEIVG